MSQYGNYKSQLKATYDPFLRLYGMKYRDSEVKKDFEFYEIISKTYGFATFKSDVLINRMMNKTLICKACKWVIKKLNYA